MCSSDLSNPADRNAISGNVDDGVALSGPGATGNVVIGNYLGTNAAGNAAIGNTDAGVALDGASDNTIGGAAPGEGNVISGNTASGIMVNASDGTIVQGNAVPPDPY